MSDIFVFLVIVVIFGVLPALWYLKREQKPSTETKPNKFFVSLTTLLVLINSLICYFMLNNSIPYVLGRVYVLPIIAMFLFALSKNWKSRVNVIFYASLVVLLSLIGSVFSKVQVIV